MTHSTSLSWTARTIRAAVMLLTCAALCSGCAAIGAIADKTAGDMPIPPKYKPKKDEPLLVLMENYNNPDTVAFSAAALERRISGDLKEHKVAPVVDYTPLDDMRSSRPQELARLSIPGVAKLVGARQVVYGNVTSFEVSQTLASNLVKAKAQIVVKVVDAETGATLWPTETSGGMPISAETSYVEMKEGVTESTVRNQLINNMAVQISRLFYPIRPSEMESPEPQIKG